MKTVLLQKVVPFSNQLSKEGFLPEHVNLTEGPFSSRGGAVFNTRMKGVLLLF